MTVGAHSVARVDREHVQDLLPQLAEWLLPGCFYSVEHTWPQLYRNDGHGAFFVIRDGSRLASHCACRLLSLHDGQRRTRVGLIGSVATAPELRGSGFASAVLDRAIDELGAEVDAFLLWAERPELYARAGFAPSGDDDCLLLARRPRVPAEGVRLATVDDYQALHRLHEQKPRRVARDLRTMSTLLSTPGMTTVVLERDGAPVAYACTGKGADLQGHWHELGGSDDDLALLLPAALHLCDQVEAALLLPPYRPRLAELLAAMVVARARVPGPMVLAATAGASAGAAIVVSGRSCWIDGLDSV